MTIFRLAHLSDLHLPMTGIRLPRRDWLSKRGLSYLSWQLRRRHRHVPASLEALFEDIAAHHADHVAVTGDVTNLTLPEEFDRSLPWLRRLGDPLDVTLIPGNHDALVPLDPARGQDLWRAWMSGDPEGKPENAPPAGDSAFPFVRRRGNVALTGVDTAISTRAFSATGKIGDSQMTRLETILRSLGEQGFFRIVLIHYPVAEGLASNRKALIDRGKLRALLARTGAELVLHGHTHRASLTPLSGPDGPIASIGVPSASGRAGQEDYASRWHLYEIGPEGDGWRLRVHARRIGADHRFHEAARYTIQIPRPRHMLAAQ
ncbi:MAG: metallophosphoesterase [Parvibaculaceae bacterium]|nr:metallophosphoesterase [Parvibaculaceae bacterium]